MERRALSNADISEIQEKQCKRCDYYGTIGGGHCCDYFLITGKRRGCSPVNCERFSLRRGAKSPMKIKFEFPGSTKLSPVNTTAAAVDLKEFTVMEPQKPQDPNKAQKPRKPRRPNKTKKPPKTHWGLLLDSYMQEHKLKQKEFAKLCRTSPDQINKWRRGAYYPSHGNLENVCRVMGIEVSLAEQVIAKGDLDG